MLFFMKFPLLRKIVSEFYLSGAKSASHELSPLYRYFKLIDLNYKFLFRTLERGKNFAFGFFVFHVKSQIPQIIIIIGRMIYHINALSVVIRTTLKSFKKLSQCRDKLSKF